MTRDVERCDGESDRNNVPSQTNPTRFEEEDHDASSCDSADEENHEKYKEKEVQACPPPIFEKAEDYQTSPAGSHKTENDRDISSASEGNDNHRDGEDSVELNFTENQGGGIYKRGENHSAHSYNSKEYENHRDEEIWEEQSINSVQHNIPNLMEPRDARHIANGNMLPVNASQERDQTPSQTRSPLHGAIIDKFTRLLLYLIGPVAERQTWETPFDSIMSLLAYTVGLGNIWRFPYYSYKHDGVNYIIAYCICLLVIGYPLYVVDISLSQYLSLGPTNVYASMAPLFSGLGWAMVATAFLVSIYYIIILAWTIIYLYSSFTKELPWTVEAYANMTGDSRNINSYEAAQKFFKFSVLKMEEEDHTGESSFSLDRVLVVSLGLAWLMVVLSLVRGIRSAGRVVYVTNTVPYIVLVLLLAWSYFQFDQDAWEEAIDLFFSPKNLNATKLLNVEVWTDASYQVLFTLGHIFGGHATLASYNTIHQNTLVISLIIVLWDTATSFLCGCVVFTSLSQFSQELKVNLSEIFNNGKQIGGIGVEVVFIAYPALLGQIGSPIWSILFFVMLLSLGIDSMLGFVETITTALFDNFNSLRRHYFPLVVLVCLVLFLLGLPMCSPSGIYMVEIMHSYSCKVSILILGLVQIFLVSYIFGLGKLLKLMREEMRIHVPKWVEYYIGLCIKILIPFAFVALLIMSAVSTKGGKHNVSSANTHIVEGDEISGTYSMIGWILASVTSLFVPGFAAYSLWNNQNNSWQELLKPTKQFRPVYTRQDDPNAPTIYRMNDDESLSGVSVSSSLHLGRPQPP